MTTQPSPGVVGRRSLLGSGAASAAVPLLAGAPAAAQPTPTPKETAVLDLVLRVNGQEHRLALDPRVTLLDALREKLGLTGAKKGCDQGQCGACTVLLDGRRVLSCLTLAARAEGGAVTTIEGLAAEDGGLHPMQQAFLDHDAFQCGYCTPGQIMSAIGCVQEGHAGTPEEIREAMSGNLCRCAAYPNIVAAIEQARPQMAGRRTERG
jgi:xanthine dehydrogenase YagT iron-sulfur-binding subunit